MTKNSDISMDLSQADLPPSKRPEVTDKEINELESFDLQTNLLNPEAFEGNRKDAEITDITSNGNNTFVVREIKGAPRVQIYQESGLINLEKRLELANITYDDIIMAIEKSGYSNAEFSGDWNPLSSMITSHLDKQIQPGEIGKIVQGIRKTTHRENYTGITLTQLRGISDQLRKSTIVPSKALNVKLSPDGERFIIRYGEEVVILQTRKDGKNLAPDDWERQLYSDRANFKADKQKTTKLGSDLDEYYVFEDKSKSLPGINVVATFGENEILTLVDKDTRTNFFRAGARDFDADPSDKKTVFFIKSEGSNVIGSIDASQTKTKKWKMSERAVDGINGKILELKLDPHGNFLNVIYETEGKEGEKTRKLAIIEKDTFKIVKEYDDAHAHLEVDPTGTIYFEDKNHQLRAVTTNFASFPEGGLEAARQAQLAQLQKLQERIGGLSIEDIKAQKGKKHATKTGELKEDALKEALAKKIADLFTEDIAKAATLEEIAEIDDRINGLKNDADFAKYPDVFISTEQKVSDKGNAIKVGSLEGLITNLEEHTANAASLEDVLGLDKEIAEVITIRQTVSIKDIAKRRELDSKLAALQKRTKALREEHVGELMQKIEGDLYSINEIIAEAQSAEELRDTLDSAQYEAVEQLIGSVGDRDVQKTLREKLRNAVNNQRSAIELKTQQHEQQERMHMAEVIVEADGILAEMSERIDAEVTDVKELEKWQRSNPLITKYTSTIIALPKDLRKEAEEKFDALIRQKRGNLEYMKTFKVSDKNGGEVQFGKEKFPRFQETQVVWSAKVEPESQYTSPDGEGHLVFEDNRGRKFRPKVGTVPMDLNNPITKGVINMCAEDARKYFEQFKRNVPHFNDTWDLNQFYQDKLEEMAKLLRIQKDQQKGALILEGEAGTGKNVLFDMFAHFTNREVFMFSCNMQSEKEDITYAFRFDPERGTYQVESRVLEALKTPGAILIFDEINSLPKGVAKMLNPLTRLSKRTLFPRRKSIFKS